MKLPEPRRRDERRTPQLTDEDPMGSVLRHAKRRQSNARKPTRRFVRWLPLGVMAALIFVFLPSASASLGGTPNSVETDRARMNASHQIMQHDSYAVHEIKAPQGTVINEYVSTDGRVFAVSWHGQFPPSMQQILGTYFDQYVAALKAQAQLSQSQPRVYGHRPLNLQLPGLVVQTSNRTGAYFGRAYIPDMLPQATIVGQIQ
jgi:hypothetical protein